MKPQSSEVIVPIKGKFTIVLVDRDGEEHDLLTDIEGPVKAICIRTEV